MSLLKKVYKKLLKEIALWIFRHVNVTFVFAQGKNIPSVKRPRRAPPVIAATLYDSWKISF